jgi:hypothetical protein
MTDAELSPYVGKPVRITLADGRLLAGTLHADHDHGHGHGHTHYAIVSDPIKSGDRPVTEVIHGASIVTQVEDASSDPAAVE